MKFNLTIGVMLLLDLNLASPPIPNRTKNLIDDRFQLGPKKGYRTIDDIRYLEIESRLCPQGRIPHLVLKYNDIPVTSNQDSLNYEK